MSVAALPSCGGGGVERVSPTPRSAFRSTYPCELLTRATAARILSIESPRRVGAQTLDGQRLCTWARGRYRAIPQIGLTIFASERFHGKETFTRMQRRFERERLPAQGYRRLSGIGDHAFLVSQGRAESSVLIAQGGRMLWLTLRLKRKPRSEPVPLAALESIARRISADFDASR